MRTSLLSPSSLLPVIAAALLLGGCDKETSGPVQGNVTVANDSAVSEDEVAPSSAPAAKADKVDRSHAGEKAPDFTFEDDAGEKTSLAELPGKPILVNLWATWCAPCVKELPTLEALSKRDGARIHVLAISQDNQADKVGPFVAEKGFKSLRVYTDPDMRWTPAVTPTLPTTILYGSDGREVLRVVGDFDWDGPEAAKLIVEAK